MSMVAGRSQWRGRVGGTRYTCMVCWCFVCLILCVYYYVEYCACVHVGGGLGGVCMWWGGTHMHDLLVCWCAGALYVLILCLIR